MTVPAAGRGGAPAVDAATAATGAATAWAAGRRRRATRRRVTTAGLALGVLAAVAVGLVVGHTVLTPAEVVRALLGDDGRGVSFTVTELRLPRAVLGALAGAGFGAAGVTFQTLLRNPLAAPDVIGIGYGASAAAVCGIVLFDPSETALSALAVLGALVTAAAIHLLAGRDGAVGARLVLIGIGVSSVLQSVVSFLLTRAGQWDLQTAMRWLSGSLGGADWARVAPLALTVAVLGPVLLAQSRALDLLGHGEEVATALGVRVRRTRGVAVLAAVALLAVATAATGPIAFVSFLAGPIARRVTGPGGSPVVPAALVGALLVLTADPIGQWALDTRYPVGVVTGALGAPFLILLLLGGNRSGGTW